MPTTTHDIVAKLWNLCNVLKDDGVTYHQYVTELTYLLFLKMAKETGTEAGIPEEWRWDELETAQGPQAAGALQAAAAGAGQFQQRQLAAGAGDLRQCHLLHPQARHAEQAGGGDRQAGLVQRPPGGPGRSV